MLSYLRKKRGSALLKGIMIAIAVSFFGGFGLLGYCGLRQKDRDIEANTVATINDDIRITRQELTQAVRRAISRKNEPRTEAEEQKLREEILETLINRELIIQEAARLGVEVTEGEITQQIVRTFQKDGVFRPEFFRSFLVANNLSESAFKEDVRQRLIISKLSGTVAAGAIVTDEDVRQTYLYENRMADMDIVKVDPEKITDVDEPAESEIRARFDADPEAVTVPEKRRVRYACLDAVEMIDPETLTQEDLEDYYEKAKDFRFAIRSRKVKARKIFFSAPFGTTQDKREIIKERAREVAADARLETYIFEGLAEKYSDDGETAPSGGDMGWVNVSEAGYPAGSALRELKPGEISGVVTGLDGFYIFKVEEEKKGKYKPFRQVRSEVVQWVRKLKGKSEAHKAAEKILENVRDGTPFLEAAKIATAEVKLSELFFESVEEIDDMPDSRQLVSATFKLWDIDQVSDAITLPEGACVLQLAEIFDEHVATYEEAVPILKDEMLAERRKESAKKLAEEILALIQSGTPFDKAAKKYKTAELINTDYFAREKGYIPKVGYSPDMVSAAFALPLHDPVADRVFEVNGKFHLIKLIGLRAADPGGFNSKAAALRSRLLMERQNEMVDSWIEALKQKAKIVRKKDEEEEGEGA